MTIVSKVVGDHQVVGATYLHGPIHNQYNSPILQASDVHPHRLFQYCQNGTAVAATVVLGVIRGASAVSLEAYAGCVAVCQSGATITVDIKKNGTTILSSTIGLSDSDTNYIPVSGTITVTTASQGDVFTAVVTVAEGAGTLGTGLFVGLKVNDQYST